MPIPNLSALPFYFEASRNHRHLCCIYLEWALNRKKESINGVQSVR